MSRDLSIQKNTLELTSLYIKDTEAYHSRVSPLKDNCNTTLIVENYALITPGIVNRTFENRTQSNSIELNPWIEFD